MSERDNRTAGGADGRELEARLDAIEARLAGLPAGDAELELLREAVKDLSADTADLRNQLDKIVSSCERLLAGGAGGVDLSAVRRNGLRESATALKRVTGRAVRGTLGAARRLMGSGESASRRAASFDLRLAQEPADRAPSIAVVVRIDSRVDDAAIPDELLAQTDPELEVVVWNESDGRAALVAGPGEPRVFDAPDRAAIAGELESESVSEWAGTLPRVDPTTIEVCRWTLASEGLPLLVQGGRAINGRETTWSIRPVAGWAADEPDPRPAKVVGGRHWIPSGLEGRVVIGAANGCGYLPGSGTEGVITHEIRPLSGVVSSPPWEDERSVIIVTATARSRRLVTWLQRELGDGHRLIAVMGDHESAGGSAGRAISELGGTVVQLGGFLDPSVHASVVADMARAYGAAAVLRIDSTDELPSLDPRPRIVDLPFHRDEIDPAADVVLALGRDLAERASQTGAEVIDLVPGPDLPPSKLATGALAGLRAAYSVPEDARLVLTWGDLTPEGRPEDAAAVARRLRDREDLWFLVVGDGPLAGTVSDIAGYFGLERFVLAPAAHTVTDLVAACDCVLQPAEEDPWPVAVAAGLALGRSVIATDIDGVRELVANADADRCSLCLPGDVDGLAAALADGLGNHRRRQATKKAWAAARARTDRCLDAIRGALAGTG